MALGTVNKSCSNTHTIVIKCSPDPGPGPSRHRTAVLTLSNHAGFRHIVAYFCTPFLSRTTGLAKTFSTASLPQLSIWLPPRLQRLNRPICPTNHTADLYHTPSSPRPPAEATRVPSPGAPGPIQVSHRKQGQPGFMLPELFHLTSPPEAPAGALRPPTGPPLLLLDSEPRTESVPHGLTFDSHGRLFEGLGSSSRKSVSCLRSGPQSLLSSTQGYSKVLLFY